MLSDRENTLKHIWRKNRKLFETIIKIENYNYITMKEAQAQVQRFNDKRDWSTAHSIKDLLLNMSEEIGEFWNLIKGVDTETQQRLLKENKDEAENFIGDMIYLIYKVAYLSGVDSEKGFNDVMKEYEKRFPVEQTKGKHANKLAGGIDLKEEK